MKKITLLFLFLSLSVLLKAQTFDFSTDGDTEGWLGKNGELTVSEGIMTLTPNNHKNPNIQYHAGIDADVNRYIHLGIKNYSDTANQIRFLLENTAKEKNFVNATMSTEDMDFQTYTLDLSEAEQWTGTVDKLTIRFTDDSNIIDGASHRFDIDFIVFDNNATLNMVSLAKHDFSFFPNPVQNEINLSATQPVDQVQIYNMLGREVLNMIFSNQLRPTIDISRLSTGSYNMKVKIGNTIGMVKIIKQ